MTWTLIVENALDWKQIRSKPELFRGNHKMLEDL